jgi:nicotinate-nucleotide adenylyltransferase
MRIGLFGGTFNPIHRGHLHIGDQICAVFPLDRICLIPCANPPHKTSCGLAPACDRLEMIRLALSGSPGSELLYYVSEVELHRSGPSYSIDTVEDFLSKNHWDAEYFMLVGLDAFLELDSWKNYLQILHRIPLIILPRSLENSQVMIDAQQEVEDFIYTKLSQSYYYDSSQLAYLHSSLRPIYITMSLSPLNISSTKVRRLVGSGESIDSLVPKKVAEYIYAKGLYR